MRWVEQIVNMVKKINKCRILETKLEWGETTLKIWEKVEA
jgi:hypothetical protein